MQECSSFRQGVPAQHAGSGARRLFTLIPFSSKQAAQAEGPSGCDTRGGAARRIRCLRTQRIFSFSLHPLCLFAATAERGNEAWKIWVAVSLVEDGSLHLSQHEREAGKVLCHASHVRHGRDGLSSFSSFCPFHILPCRLVLTLVPGQCNIAYLVNLRRSWHTLHAIA